MKLLRASLLALLLGAIVTASGYSIAAFNAGASDAATPVGPGLVTVNVDIEHSRFRGVDLAVRVGTLVRFVVRNADPINHEFMIGDTALHARHERGTEGSHPPVPGEVSVGPGENGVTTYRFDTAGTVTFACHLPGHLAYGMVGTIIAVA